MSDIRSQSLAKPVDVGEYLFTRLHQIGIRSVHGLPGDYNLVACDYVPKCQLTWVGNCNELNAAYAADGYARVKGISAIMTTFGVGELSAINGIAGAYSEHVPVIHIVGCPSTVAQRSGSLLHHTLGNGDYNVFANMSVGITCEVAKLYQPSEIAAQIDHAIRECWIHSRPVYIMLPSDMVTKKVEGARLEIPIDLSYPVNDEAKENYVVDVVLGYLHKAKNPVMLVDACAIRHNVLDEVHEFADKTQLPIFVSPMGKGAVDETKSNYCGVYAGETSEPQVRERLESSDLILSIGGMKSDFNTGGFTYHTSQLNTIDFHSTKIVVRYSEYPGVGMKGVLRKLIGKAGKLSVVSGPTVSNEVEKHRDASDAITQAFFWPRVGEYFKENDVIVTETGTSNFGIWAAKFPRGVTALNQVLWGSIGWSVGAAQGAALAVKDSGEARRTILFVGDGSFELTAQEVSTMVRHDLPVTIFLVNNEGYTVERWIHGMDAGYNDIQNWNFTELVSVFGGKDRKFRVKTKAELEALLTDAEFNSSRQLQFVEVFMPKEDAPTALKLSAQVAARLNDAAN